LTKENESSAKQTILAVDDTPENLDVVKGVLSGEYTVKAAINGKMALKVAESQKPDLILLDIMMPEMDGYEVCRRLKSDPETADIPVIFLTAKGETEDEAKGLALGAADYIMKPVSPPILEARVKTHLSLQQHLQDLKTAYEVINSQKERMQGELNVGADIQMSMLPSSDDGFSNRNEFSVSAMLKPAREVGGDFYDLFYVSRDELCLVVADVSGKGVPSALFMAVSKTMIKSRAADDRSPASIITRVNDEISLDNPSSMFVTVFFCILNLKTGELRYTNAGHNPPYILKVDGTLQKITELHGPVIGAMDGLAYGEDSVQLGRGDKIFLFTDGVTEAMDVNSELFSDPRLEEFLVTQKSCDAQGTVENALAEVEAFAGKAEQADDITIVALSLDVDPSEIAKASHSLTIRNDLSEVDRINAAFDEFAEENGIPMEIGLKINIAFDELITNVVSYAYSDEDEHEIQVNLDLFGDRLTVEIVDDGKPFNPLTLDDPDTTLGIDEREIGGLGIHLVKNMMDDIVYTRRSDSNSVTLIKVLSNEEG
jgi:sigma-B regulation protein RsbU (phosphoserine phosphatase)